MLALLGIWGLLSFAIGILILMAAQGAIHETEAALAFLIGTVSLASAAQLEMLRDIRRTIKEMHRSNQQRAKQESQGAISLTASDVAD
jgi:hypothetical protein